MENGQILDHALKKIARGTAIALVGTIAAMLLGFGTRVAIVRFVTQGEYGIYALALVLVSIFTMVATLGLQQGATRYIAYFRGTTEPAKIRDVAVSSVMFTLIASIFLTSVVVLVSDPLSTGLFDKPELSTPLKIFSAAIPFAALVAIWTSLFRGFDRVDVKVYFQDTLMKVLFLLLLVPVIVLRSAFLGVVYAYLASAVITCLSLTLYAVRKLPIRLVGTEKATSMKRELFLFSLPLLVNSMLFMIIQWTDTLMLGYFRASEDVGLYNGALPLAELTMVFSTSMAFIYVPVLSQLYSRGLMGEMRRSYQVVTKWVFSVSLPVFLLLALFPSAILNFFFGHQYVEAAQALRILSVGLIFHTFFGLSGLTLMLMGRTRLVLWTSLLGATVNVALNLAFIPLLGIVGAAIASATSYFAMSAIRSTRLYQLYGIHPFTWNYLKPAVVAGIIVSIIYVAATNLFTIAFWMLPLLFVLFLAVYGISLLLTKSVDSEDISLLLAVEKRLGVDTRVIKRILRRFVRSSSRHG